MCGIADMIIDSEFMKSVGGGRCKPATAGMQSQPSQLVSAPLTIDELVLNARLAYNAWFAASSEMASVLEWAVAPERSDMCIDCVALVRENTSDGFRITWFRWDDIRSGQGRFTHMDLDDTLAFVVKRHEKTPEDVNFCIAGGHLNMLVGNTGRK